MGTEAAGGTAACATEMLLRSGHGDLTWRVDENFQGELKTENICLLILEREDRGQGRESLITPPYVPDWESNPKLFGVPGDTPNN